MTGTDNSPTASLYPHLSIRTARALQKGTPTMNELLLPVAIWLQVTSGEMALRLRESWDRRDDDDGIDEAVTKMIWLAVGIAVAVAATAFFISVFNSAKSSVPDPVAPTP